MLKHRILKLVIAAATIASGAWSVGLGAPASAATLPTSTQASQASSISHSDIPQNGSKPICSDDLCARWFDKTSTSVMVDTWADTATFFGHFEIFVPNGAHYNSAPNKNWIGHGKGYDFKVGVYPHAYECIAWKYNPKTHTYTDIGQVYFLV
jgi:hypothetical protein